MKHYRSYMDRVSVPEELHEKLLDLEAPKKPARRPMWQRYGALAACAALLIGVGVLGARVYKKWEHWNALVSSYDPLAVSSAEIEVAAIDLAPEDPNGAEPGMRTIPGFEVRKNMAGLDVVEYYILPWIDYGEPNGEEVSAGVSLDYAAPEDATFRALGHDDVLALVGGEEALETLLDWGSFEFSGAATFNADGSVWQMSFSGKRDDYFFELELAPDALPLTCIITEPHTTTEIWGVEVTGRYSGIHGEGPDREVWMPESRNVEFIAGGVGCRFTLYGLEGDSDGVETMVSRFVRQAILEGLDLSAVGPEGASVPVDGGPDAPWDEPYEDAPSSAPSVGPQEAGVPADDPGAG